jgi:hypothetical protein
MRANNEQRKASPYLLLLAVQILGAITLTWQVLPEFRQLAINPGDQLPRDGFSDIVSVGVLCVMQIAFWCRVLFVPIPFRRPRAILNHVFLFLGKLSFIRIDYAGVFGIGTRLQASQANNRRDQLRRCRAPIRCPLCRPIITDHSACTHRTSICNLAGELNGCKSNDVDSSHPNAANTRDCHCIERISRSVSIP